MSRYTDKYCRGFSREDDSFIIAMVEAGTSTGEIAERLGRSSSETFARMCDLQHDPDGRRFRQKIDAISDFIFNHIDELGVEGCAQALDISTTQVRCTAYKVGKGKTHDFGRRSVERGNQVRNMWGTMTFGSMVKRLKISRVSTINLVRAHGASSLQEDLKNREVSRLLWMTGDEARTLAGETRCDIKYIKRLGPMHHVFDGSRLVMLHELLDNPNPLIEHMHRRPKGASVAGHAALYLEEIYDASRINSIIKRYVRI